MSNVPPKPREDAWAMRKAWLPEFHDCGLQKYWSIRTYYGPHPSESLKGINVWHRCYSPTFFTCLELTFGSEEFKKALREELIKRDYILAKIPKTRNKCLFF